MNVAICNANNNNSNNNNQKFKYLKFNKQSKCLKKVNRKIIYRFWLSVCPICYYSNCIDCTKTRYKNYMKQYNNIFKNKKQQLTINTTTKGVIFPRYIKCFNCQNTFSLRRSINKLYKCIGYQCNKCQKKYSEIYSEYLTYIRTGNANALPLRKILNIHYGDITCLSRKKRIQYIYEKYLTPQIKKELNNEYNSLYYHLKVKKEKSEEIVMIPPLAFLCDQNRPVSFYLKLLEKGNHLDIKTSYGSVNSRSSGGKNSMYRDACLVKRYTGCARAVIVPRQFLLPHECILPESIYKALNFPKHVLLHRYATLDLKSMVIGFIHLLHS